ncbi:TIGR02466 family protein [Catellatospora sp. NPDC049133]|uniref:TIGR02466 family protein n=1 Tax=Catellatospora sp. NPDC049133 TaxID=3155499 RepID=UPI0033C1AAFC
MKGQLHSLWSTPVLAFRPPAPDGFNDRLRELILARQSDPGGTMIGVVDADKTRADVLRWPGPEVDQLRSWILDVAEAMNGHVGAGADSRNRPVAMIAEAWAVVYRSWGFHHMHSHPGAAWSGVYYVHTGAFTPGTGAIEFLDPRPAANARTPDRSPLTALDPEPGLMLAFPAWQQHWVTPYAGDSTRICVAFNIGFEN